MQAASGVAETWRYSTNAPRAGQPSLSVSFRLNSLAISRASSLAFRRSFFAASSRLERSAYNPNTKNPITQNTNSTCLNHPAQPRAKSYPPVQNALVNTLQGAESTLVPPTTNAIGKASQASPKMGTKIRKQPIHPSAVACLPDLFTTTAFLKKRFYGWNIESS